MSTNIAPQDIGEQDSANGSSKDELTPRVMGELRNILDKALPVDETGRLDGVYLYYSIPGPGIRYYSFEAPEGASREAKGS